MAFWDKIQSNGDIEDRRGSSGVATGIGSIGAVIVVGVLMFAGGADSSQITKFVTDSLQTQNTNQSEFVDTKNYKQFAQRIIGSNNEIWSREFKTQGVEYQKPKLVLFRGQTNSGCGGADSQTGPHYCPSDQTIYLDETFFEELKTRFGAQGGEVAESYVMAHEVGHHVQKVLGTFNKVNTRNNQNSVKVELQADCYAGLWAGNIKEEGIINESEINQAIDAAASVGDDRIQKATTGSVNPETWTHGSSEQRKQAFLKGYQTKSFSQCNF